MPLGIVVGRTVLEQETDLAFAGNGKRSVYRKSRTVAGVKPQHRAFGYFHLQPRRLVYEAGERTREIGVDDEPSGAQNIEIFRPTALLAHRSVELEAAFGPVPCAVEQNIERSPAQGIAGLDYSAKLVETQNPTRAVVDVRRNGGAFPNADSDRENAGERRHGDGVGKNVERSPRTERKALGFIGAESVAGSAGYLDLEDVIKPRQIDRCALARYRAEHCGVGEPVRGLKRIAGSVQVRLFDAGEARSDRAADGPVGRIGPIRVFSARPHKRA